MVGFYEAIKKCSYLLGLPKSCGWILGILKFRGDFLRVLKSLDSNLGVPKILSQLFSALEVGVDPISHKCCEHFALLLTGFKLKTFVIYSIKIQELNLMTFQVV